MKDFTIIVLKNGIPKVVKVSPKTRVTIEQAYYKQLRKTVKK